MKINKQGINSLLRFIKAVVSSFNTKQQIVFGLFSTLLIVSSLVLIFKLNEELKISVPQRGGSISEGIVGTPRFINPVIAVSNADRALTSIVFSGLLKKDENGNIIPDLASSYEISEDGKTYTFFIKENLTFHNGQKLTAEDVVFTIEKIKDPAIKSPLRAEWEGITVQAVDEMTVEFNLGKAFSPFVEYATVGILPKSLWQDIYAEEFALTDYNLYAIGSGPYEISGINKNDGVPESFVLKSFKDYSLGEPFIKNITIKSFDNEEDAAKSFKAGNIDLVGILSTDNSEAITKNAEKVEVSTLPRIFSIFINPSNNEVLGDQKLLTVLSGAINRDELVKNVLDGFGVSLYGPLPENNYPKYIKTLSAEEAGVALDELGWKLNGENIRNKEINKKKVYLSFTLSTSDAPELSETARMVSEMMATVGVEIKVQPYEIGTLNQDIIRPRDYEMLLFGQVLASDTDLYSFWHSSQRNDPGINVGKYASVRADSLLEQAVEEIDREEQEKLLAEAADVIARENGAIFLYAPSYIYALNKDIGNLSINKISSTVDRFANIEDWYVLTERVWKIFK